MLRGVSFLGTTISLCSTILYYKVGRLLCFASCFVVDVVHLFFVNEYSFI